MPVVSPHDGAGQAFRQLFEHMSEGVALHEILLDPAGRAFDYRFLQVNAAFERLTGLRAAEVVGRTALEVIPALEAEFIARYAHVALTGEPMRFELRADALGRIFHVSAYRPEPLHFACVFTDVTAERSAQAELRAALRRAEASEHQLRLVVSQSRDVIWTFDLAAGRFTYVSPSIEALRGLTVEEALAEPMERALTPESLARVMAVAARNGTPEEENPHTGVYDQPCKDGSIKHVEMTTTYQRGPDGRPRTVVGISRDATDRVRAERALRRSEALYRCLFTATPSGVILTGPDGRILAFNDRAAAQLGYTREAFARLAIPDIDAEDDADRVRSRIRQAMQDGHLEFDTRHRSRTGELREVHVRIVPVDLGEGTALLSTWDDVTEQQRLTRELQLGLAERDERERWLQASQRVARLGHYVFEVREDRWVSSPMLDEIFGIGPEHPRTTASWLGLVHPDDRADLTDHLSALAAAGSRFDRVYRVGRPGDPPRWVHGLGDLERDEAGRPLRLVGTIQDVTARHQAELVREGLADQLRQAQKLESIGRLAGGVAHDFNNILVVLLACGEALQRSLDEGRPPEREDVQEILEAAARAKDLTSQLLAFARKKVVAPVPVDLNEEVRRAERMLHRLLGEDVALVLRLAPALWATTCDPGQLQQLLVNLAVNARDAMPGGGRLTLSTANVDEPGAGEAGWRGLAPAAGPHVRLVVEDTGGGIPPELWSRLFEPFVTTKPAGRGTGLGLATALGIAQQAGGVIRFRSQPGCGAAFEVLLPRTEATVAGPADPGRAPGPLTQATERILLVEDDQHVRDATSRALRQAGYQVVTAAGGAELQALLGPDLPAPQLLLTDVVMPGMNGRQVAEAARRAFPGLRVLFMSGYAQDIIVHHGVVDPGLDLLEKPFTNEALLRRVRAALDA
ncbi:MAG: PAS domain S-box protein [Anaeromyxobacter sp.]|nr:PAS domain S-box protein [Anaeromyxobacter sp.]MBL0276970.1 PAS domain S-box protein [Anaeromyxobacter sp.]